MVETQFLFTLVYILFYAFIGVTIIAVTLLIILAILFGNSKN